GLAFGQPGGDKLALNQRHVRAIEASAEAIRRARRSLERGPELIALELREALDHLGQILGQVTPDDVLGRVFRSFCIGK
ncbi:MAG: tRNA uridine-5-carboxymethylaminomethyl(34) synthesis GTPase MnmE, partial [Phycisphaerae bacterium]|nr:tRNA uridine-5-carboxymethylaminomethyl(34) synthesis GTPase MnmE [Phycisphaerae bacterium]